jgi:hypothetical protein
MSFKNLKNDTTIDETKFIVGLDFGNETSTISFLT